MNENPVNMISPYFFLSYERSDPLTGPAGHPDHLVERFFRDLSNAVQNLATRTTGAVSGFFDQRLPVGSDLKQSITLALSATQVFVPLYTVGYLTNSWPGREFACFTDRLKQTGRPNPDRRLVPVLWAPLAGVDDPPGLRDAPAVEDEPDYAANGLRALLKLKYDELYDGIVVQIARQIVHLAEGDPIEPVEPSQVPDIETVDSAFSPSAPLAIFDIQVAALTSATASPDGNRTAYGATPFLWRPFPGLKLPLVKYAQQTAERFDFATRVSELSVPPSGTRQRPGVVIIDPAFAADEDGVSMLRSVAKFPRWILPLVVIREPGDKRARELASKVEAILKAEDPATESARKGAEGVSSFDEFQSLFPVLVAEAERQYLRHRTSRVASPRSTRRPRLGQGDGPGGSAVSSGSLRRRNACWGSRAATGRRPNRDVLFFQGRNRAHHGAGQHRLDSGRQRQTRADRRLGPRVTRLAPLLPALYGPKYQPYARRRRLHPPLRMGGPRGGRPHRRPSPRGCG
jgi:FxsC-like protein